MLLMRGSLARGLANILIIIAVFGVVIPLQSGAEWFNVPLLQIVWAWVPLFMSTWLVADAIAGERERHTLETLLASRLSDKAILLGKVGAAVLYGFGIELVNLLLAAVTVNIAHPQSGFQFYQPEFFLCLIAFGFLGSMLLGTLGVLVSLHSATARQAYQRLSLVFIVIWVLPSVALNFIPKSITSQLSGLMEGLDYTRLLGILCLALLLIDALLLAIDFKKFQRKNLVLI